MAIAHEWSRSVNRAAEPEPILKKHIRNRGDVLRNESALSGVDEENGGSSVPSLSDHRGAVVVASVWLVFYVFIAINHFMAPGD